MTNSQVSNISIYVYILIWGIGNSNNIVFIQFTAILCILIRVAKGGKCPVNFGNIVDILETLQDFLESSRDFWKVSVNVPSPCNPNFNHSRGAKN